MEAIARVLEHHEGKVTLQILIDESEIGRERRLLKWVEVVLGSLLSQDPGFRLLGGRSFMGRAIRFRQDFAQHRTWRLQLTLLPKDLTHKLLR